MKKLVCIFAIVMALIIQDVMAEGLANKIESKKYFL